MNHIALNASWGVLFVLTINFQSDTTTRYLVPLNRERVSELYNMADWFPCLCEVSSLPSNPQFPLIQIIQQIQQW